jgi:hypothetical protein
MKINAVGYLGFESPAALAWEGMRGVRHFCIKANTLNDLGIAYDPVQEPQVPVWPTLGRHQDRLVSLFVRSPNGVDIEFSVGGWQLGDEFVQRDQSNSEPSRHQQLVPEREPSVPKVEG